MKRVDSNETEFMYNFIKLALSCNELKQRDLTIKID